MNEDDFIKHIGFRIKEIRIAKGYKQIDLAVKLEIEDAALRRIEAGRTNATVKTLYKIANALEVDICDLFPANLHTTENEG